MFLIKPFDNFLSKFLLTISSLLFFVLISIGLVYIYLEINLPDVETLKDIHFQEPLRIYSKDKKLIREFGSKRRIPITLNEVPKTLINAILATEDQRFFEHPGIDFPGLLRATIHILKTGKKSQGASTITMQVARNFFLSRKKTYSRKINEILLAIKIDKELSKEKILELYLNKIYFGHGAYGVAAAATVYYDKNLNGLTLAQFAMLAGLPQAPSRINPITNPTAALNRRKYVLKRMLDEAAITKQEYENAMEQPITAKYHQKKIELHAPYVAEMIRNRLYQHLGEAIYTSGYKVYSTIDSKKQLAANAALAKALEDYDQRHGYRGILDNATELNSIEWKKYPKTEKQLLAVVTNIEDSVTTAQLENGDIIQLFFENMQWARRNRAKGMLGPQPTEPGEILKKGDIIHVKKTKKELWALTQIPKAEGGLIAINPKNNHIVSLVGGYNFKLNNYNHITQAKRQPGSSFKPFIYAAALEKGYTLASTINDAPIVQKDQSQDNFWWRPQNDNHKFSGLTSLRRGLVLSKNLVSIRLLDAIGLDFARSFVARFGFPLEDIPRTLSIALGSATVSPLTLATGYCVFANEGQESKPYIINSIFDSKEKNLYDKENDLSKNNDAPSTDNKKNIINPQIAYLISSVLNNALHHGRTGQLAKKELQRSDIVGKTGTTNDNKDAWFAGFNPSLVAVSWVGFDIPESLFEYGGRAAFPMWLDFMKNALKETSIQTQKEPNDIVRVRIDPTTGLLASSEEPNSFFEVFRSENAPSTYAHNEEQEITDVTEYLF